MDRPPKLWPDPGMRPVRPNPSAAGRAFPNSPSEAGFPDSIGLRPEYRSDSNTPKIRRTNNIWPSPTGFEEASSLGWPASQRLSGDSRISPTKAES